MSLKNGSLLPRRAQQGEIPEKAQEEGFHEGWVRLATAFEGLQVQRPAGSAARTNAEHYRVGALRNPIPFSMERIRAIGFKHT